MILRAFYDFLTSDDELTDDVRQGGRERLRNLIASEIYHGRRPRGAGPVCVTIDRAGGIVHSAIDSPAAIESPILDLHIFAKDKDDKGGSEAVEDVYDALKDLLPQYAGPFGDQTVQTVSQETEPFSSPINPIDAQDNWTHHYIISYMIGAARVVPTGAN